MDRGRSGLGQCTQRVLHVRAHAFSQRCLKQATQVLRIVRQTVLVAKYVEHRHIVFGTLDQCALVADLYVTFIQNPKLDAGALSLSKSQAKPTVLHACRERVARNARCGCFEHHLPYQQPVSDIQIRWQIPNSQVFTE